jgi:hypothetical protein
MNCPKCFKALASKRSLEYHLSHDVCQKTAHICHICDTTFSSRQRLDYHISKNVCVKNNKIHIHLKDIPEQGSYKDLYEENLRLKGENRALRENPQTVNNIKTEINIGVPPAFLQTDNCQQISQQLPNLLHDALVKHPANFISFLIKETNCNPERPLYNSIKITNRKDSFLQISDGKKYVYAPKQTTISQLIENKKDILQQYVDESGDKYGQKVLKKYQNYVDFLDDDKNAQKNLELEIICMLLNMSGIIGSDEWSKKLLEDLKTCDTPD